MGTKKILCTKDDLGYAKKELHNLAKQDSFVYQLTLENADLIIHFSELETPIDADVLIIEDNISYICKYMKVLNEIEGAKAVVACTSAIATQYLISMKKLKDSRKLKLIFLDFDLDQLVDGKKSAAIALDLYNFICDTLTHNFKLYGITGFEGHYDVKNFKILELEMRKRSDDVFNKNLIDDDNIFLNNLVRNVITLFEKENTTVESKPVAFSKPEKKQNINTPKNIPSHTDLKKVESFLNRLEGAIASICPSDERFVKNHHFDKVEKGEGGFYSSYQTIDSFVKKHAKTLNYIFNSYIAEKYPCVKHQILNHNLFLGQGIRIN